MQTMSLSQLSSKLNDYQYFVIDKNVYGLHLKDVLSGKSLFMVDSSEKGKNLETYQMACDFFIENGLKRSDTIVCIGGGATTDLGGFVASTIYRGVSWVAVPTTLLSMIDASIGGKVGINTKHGKNLIGSFHNPIEEFLSLDFLETLSHSQIESGKGELLKYAFLSKDIAEALKESTSYKDLIKGCIDFKKNIVAQDFKESGLRAILNYGHTFGHAFEKLSEVDHGMAVAVGIKLNIELFSKELKKYLEDFLGLLDLNLSHKKVALDDFLDVLEFDKKNRAKSEIRFVVVDPIGKTRLIDMKRKELKKILQDSVVYDHYFL